MPIDPLSILIGAVVTSVVGAVGYLGKRYVSGEGDRERAALMSSYAGIAATLKNNGLSIEEVGQIGEVIRTRKRKQETLAPAQDAAPISAYWTQRAMNIRASGAANVAEAQLQGCIAELTFILRDEEIDAFQRAQAAWETFSDLQATFVALEVEGGSMAPLVHSSERETVTLQRVAALRAIIDERKDR